jgi:hypothetical protein
LEIVGRCVDRCKIATQKKKELKFSNFSQPCSIKLLLLSLKKYGTFCPMLQLRTPALCTQAKAPLSFTQRARRLALAMVVFLDIGYVRIRNHFVELVTKKKVRDLAKSTKLQAQAPWLLTK